MNHEATTAPETVLNYYAANAVGVHDGDTVRLNIDLGFGITLTDRLVDLAGIDAPELRRATMKAGKEARAALESKILGKPLLLQLSGTAPHDRPAVILYVREGEGLINVNRWLVEEGCAKYV